ncbi:QVPTGV class sortase B protein-sorting domain-containing protein [Streptococcus dysgalactiae]|uniref:QVPTGV class sortase B protein-sorting domain-containing protein n=1 Tax=Streptococcus dysgalactiae TaxID=1334 RepID=UPI00403C1CB7
MKNYKVLLTSAMLAAAVAGASAVHADNPVPKRTIVEIKKTVDLTDAKILMPKTSFNFTVEPDQSARGTKDNLDVKPGIPVTGQNLKVDYTNGDKPGTKDKTTTVDFANVEFPKAGIYRYIVKETKGNTPGVTYDGKTYVVDVYAYDGDNGKPVATYVVSHEQGKTAKEPIAFNNQLKTTSLTVKKIVAGNAGERDRDFIFTLELTANDQFEAGQKVTFIKHDKDKKDTPVEVTIGEATSFNLKDGESVVLDKLPIGISYKVNETKVEGYTTSAKLTDGDKVATEYVLGNEYTSDETADVIDVTNTKEGIIPTGVVNTIAPFAALAIVAIGGSLYFVKRKKA